jgi:hypothetical protein
MRGILASVVVLAISACADQSNEFDTRLREMAGNDERQLLGSMGRIPDNTYQLNQDTRILQWRWDTSYISPGIAPVYYVGGGWGSPYPGYGWGGSWVPVGGLPPTLVRQGCIVEWTVANGATRSYRWQGRGCGSVTIHSSPPPG